MAGARDHVGKHRRQVPDDERVGFDAVGTPDDPLLGWSDVRRHREVDRIGIDARRHDGGTVEEHDGTGRQKREPEAVETDRTARGRDGRRRRGQDGRAGGTPVARARISPAMKVSASAPTGSRVSSSYQMPRRPRTRPCAGQRSSGWRCAPAASVTACRAIRRSARSAVAPPDRCRAAAAPRRAPGRLRRSPGGRDRGRSAGVPRAPRPRAPRPHRGRR